MSGKGKNVVQKLAKQLEEELRKAGLEVRRRETIGGSSGFEHFFDLVVERSNGKKLAVSIARRITSEHVFSLLVSRIDINIPHIVIAGETEPEAIELLKRCNISVLSRPDLTVALSTDVSEESAKLISKIIRNVILETTGQE